MSPSASNSGACSSSLIRISAVGRPAAPGCSLRAEVRPAPSMAGITLASPSTARAERRDPPPSMAAGSARKLRGRQAALAPATAAIPADKPFASARPSSSSEVIRRRAVPPAEAGRRGVAAPEPPHGAPAAGQPTAAAAAAGTVAADITKTIFFPRARIAPPSDSSPSFLFKFISLHNMCYRKFILLPP